MALNLIRRLRQAASSFANPDGWMLRMFGGAQSATGLQIDPNVGQSVVAVYACVEVIASLASLPIHLMKRLPNGGKTRAVDHPKYRLFHAQPNEYQTPMEFWETLVGHAALRGHCFAQKIENRAGRLTALLPLHPDRLTAELSPDYSEVIYRYQPRLGAERLFGPEELFRIVTNSCDGGWTGRSRVLLAQEAVALAVAAEKFGAKFFAQGASHAGVLQVPKALTKQAFEQLKSEWAAKQTGLENANKTPILTDGATWQTVGMKLSEAQFIESRKYSRRDMASLFGVRPHKIGDLEDATFTNIENQSIEHVVDTIRPWAVRFEQAIWRDLLDPDEQDQYFVSFLIDGLLRGDLASRYAAYATGKQWGWLNSDEIREKEDLNPLPDGEGQVYLTPLNMVPADQLNPSPSQPKRGEAAAIAGLRGVVQEALHRTTRREAQLAKDLVSAYDRHGPVMVSTLEAAVGPVLTMVAATLGGQLQPRVQLDLRPLLERWVSAYVKRAVQRWAGANVGERLAALEAGPEPADVQDLTAAIFTLVRGALYAVAA